MGEFLGHPVRSFPEGTRTAVDAAAAVGCDVFATTPGETVAMTGGRVEDVAQR